MRFRPDVAEEDDALVVMVPRNNRAPLTTAPERARRLRLHLVKTLRAPRPAVKPDNATLPAVEELAGLAARVAGVACGLCEGWCCKGGGDHAYLDEPTIARMRETTGLSSRALLRLYLDRVPETGMAGSCIYHAPSGCTLDRAMRSDICNNYFCNGLGGYVAGADPASPVMVIAGEGTRMRRSGVLTE